MDNLYIAPTPTSPEVNFRFDVNSLSLRGESYPENAAAFYGDIIKATKDYLSKGGKRHIEVNIALAYFNSSSTKMLFNLIGALDAAAENGDVVDLNWFHDEEDDTILEFGQELSDDFPALNFVCHAVSGE